MSEMILTDERFQELMRAVELALLDKGITDEEAADLVTRVGWISGLPAVLKHNRPLLRMQKRLADLREALPKSIEDEVMLRLDAAQKGKGDAS